MNDVILLYVIVSLIWLAILILSILIYGTSYYSAIVSLLFLIAYVPLAYYYVSRGEVYKLQESLFLAIVLLIVYAIAQAIYAIQYVRRRMVRA